MLSLAQESVPPVVDCQFPILGPIAANRPSPVASLIPQTVQSSQVLDATNKCNNIPQNELEATKYMKLVPDLAFFDTFEEAVYGMKVSFGGKLVQDDNKPQAKGNHM